MDPEGLEEGEKKLYRPYEHLQCQKKQRGLLKDLGRAGRRKRRASPNWWIDASFTSTTPRKSIPTQLVIISYGLFILLALPSFCSYEPQTPGRWHTFFYSIKYQSKRFFLSQKFDNTK